MAGNTCLELLNHYRQFSAFTYAGPYHRLIQYELPDDVREVGRLLRRQIVHRVTLANGNTGSNSDLRYGDMTKVPWWRQPEDDNFPTAAAMLAELFRRDEQGFSLERKVENKLIVTCRFVAILMASVLKCKGIPARVRSGFDPYTSPRPGKSCDHWITQYWHGEQRRWLTIDVDNCLEELDFDPFDVPPEVFDWSAEVWLAAREGKVDSTRFWNAGGFEGLMPIAWALFDDFHCLMNNEIIYNHIPKQVAIGEFDRITLANLEKMDDLARLMLQPDENFNALCQIWQAQADMRLLSGSLLN
ncbi:MAG: hypothetical protein C5B53_13605 [Candidatus Melainabacteria bacterium]|nr:MAG: hypothetical protein C5B53_13605 [Candidatus Melainabacteria bacterium]